MDRNQVKVDAVKYAYSKEDWKKPTSNVDSGKDYLSIRTRYPGHDQTFNLGIALQSPPQVEYTRTVPRLRGSMKLS